MYSKTSVRSSAFVGQERPWTSSFLERGEEAFGDRVIEAVAAAAHRLGDPGGAGLLTEREADELGGFQRSSQHSMMEGCDGQAEGVGWAAGGAAGDAFAGTAAGRSARASSAVLGGDRAWRAQRRG